ncbi:MAG: alpha/beta fold hydrolase [Cyanobacteria bacterium J06638_28]
MMNAAVTTSVAPQIRDWYWRGWKVRYWVIAPLQPQIPSQPPILLLHGFGASLEQWRSNYAALAAERSVYAIDLLGFGASQKAATTFSVDLWSEQVRDFCRLCIGCPVVLMGHSLGALISLNLAVVDADIIDRLVLLTLPAAREELLTTGWLEVTARTLERIFATPLLIRPLFQLVRQTPIIRRTLQGLYQSQDLVDTALVEQFVRPTRDRGAARTLCYLVRSRTEIQFTPATQTLMQQLQVPTLLLWGDLDKVIPLSWGNRLAPLNTCVDFVVIPNVGHFLYEDAAVTINQQILAWLAEARGSHHLELESSC